MHVLCRALVTDGKIAYQLNLEVDNLLSVCPLCIIPVCAAEPLHSAYFRCILWHIHGMPYSTVTTGGHARACSLLEATLNALISCTPDTASGCLAPALPLVRS